MRHCSSSFRRGRYTAAWLRFHRASHFLVAVSFVLLLLSCGCSDPAPTCIFEPIGSNEHEFGKCHQGDVLTHEFRLINRGTVPIRLLEVVSSCSCLITQGDESFGKQPVPPQGTLAIPAAMRIGNSESVATATIKVSYAPESDITTSAGTEVSQVNNVVLLLRAEVIPDYRLSPTELDFGEVDGLTEQRAEKVVLISPEAMRNLEVRNALAAGECISAGIQSASNNDKEETEILVTLDVSNCISSQACVGSITIETNSNRVPKAIIPVRANYRSPIQLQPNTVEIGSDVEGEVKKDIVVTTTVPSQIRLAKEDSAQVGLKYDSHRRSTKHSLWVHIPPCKADHLDAVVKLEIVLFPENKQEVVRETSVPVFRFYWSKE